MLFKLHQILQGKLQMKKYKTQKSVLASPLLSSIIVIITIVKTIIEDDRPIQHHLSGLIYRIGWVRSSKEESAVGT